MPLPDRASRAGSRLDAADLARSPRQEPAPSIAAPPTQAWAARPSDDAVLSQHADAIARTHRRVAPESSRAHAGTAARTSAPAGAPAARRSSTSSGSTPSATIMAGLVDGAAPQSPGPQWSIALDQPRLRPGPPAPPPSDARQRARRPTPRRSAVAGPGGVGGRAGPAARPAAGPPCPCRRPMARHGSGGAGCRRPEPEQVTPAEMTVRGRRSRSGSRSSTRRPARRHDRHR